MKSQKDRSGYEHAMVGAMTARLYAIRQLLDTVRDNAEEERRARS